MNEPDFHKINQFLRVVLQRSSEILSDASKSAIEHYLDHDEYEMALEGLLIELLAANRFPEDLDWKQLVDVGRELGIDREAVLDVEAWPKFLSIAQQQQRDPE